ncbi:MAG: hypothetical protein FWD63_09720 [Propionibacteriaceae bacterium]|nr:hypothetical protein [Propionibacteriaceae bacterium]
MNDQISAQEALAMVNDPTTPGAALQDIATHYPNLWQEIAAHPHAYPELRAWLNAQQVSTEALTEPLPAVPDAPEAQTPAAMPQPAWPNFDQPAPRSNAISKPMLALIIVLAVALVVAIGVFAFLLLGKPAPSGSGSSASQSSTSSTPATTAPTTVITVTETQTVAPPDPEAVAYQNLVNQANADLPQVQAHLQDLWTNLLATKTAGVLADGTLWDYQSIWDLFAVYKMSYPSAVLVQGSAYTSTNLGPEWFLIASGVQFGTADSALAWCAGFGYSDDQCFAFRFTDAPGTNSKHQG